MRIEAFALKTAASLAPDWARVSYLPETRAIYVAGFSNTAMFLSPFEGEDELYARLRRAMSVERRAAEEAVGYMVEGLRCLHERQD
jgi:hypothetical protein